MSYTLLTLYRTGAVAGAIEWSKKSMPYPSSEVMKVTMVPNGFKLTLGRVEIHLMKL